MLRALQSMYCVVKARVRCGRGVTDLFLCPKGLKQGEITSPLLFSLFINEVAVEIMRSGKHGVQLFPDLLEIFILLFADDIAVLSDTPRGLQTQLDILASNANALDLSVNLEKSNIIVFRNGGFLASNEHWTFNGNEVSVVNAYKYLRLYFSTRLSFSRAFEDLAARGRKGTVEVYRILWKLGDVSPVLFFKMFDSQISPILMYGSEVWGLHNHNVIEKVHLFALKKLLNVAPRTPNDLVYGDTGRYPLFVKARVNCLRYWLRLVRMDENRLPKKAYNMLLHLHGSGKYCWATAVHDELYRNGYGYVWENQGVQNVKSFLNAYRQRLIDTFGQSWHSHITESPRFLVYRQFKSSIYLEEYFYEIHNKHLRDLLVRFRIGVSEIKTHKLRYFCGRGQDLSCPLCSARLEDEVHFLFHCERLVDLRNKFIPVKYHRWMPVSLKKLFTDKLCLQNVARFIYYGLKRRQKYLPAS